MISLLQLNKLKFLAFFFAILIFSTALAEDEEVDIWKKEKTKNDQNKAINEKENKKIKSPILLEDLNNAAIKINEDKIEKRNQSIIGIFDPAENNFNLGMWENTDGNEIKKILKRIDKLKLSPTSEELLFKVLFTNSYAPQNNLDVEEFLKIKISWLIKKKRIIDLENLLKNNSEVGENPAATKFLINEYLSSADIKSACSKIKFISTKAQSNYLEKFRIYCLINDGRKEEAQLIFDLLIENGFNDKFFEDKINFLLNITEKTTSKILDDNLLNFYLSYVTSDDFQYKPTDKTPKYIWKYLSSANLIEVNNLEDEDIILSYEQAAKQNSFDKEEIFEIYLKMNFNFNQLANAEEIYKNLKNYEARALIYQSILLTDNSSKKIYLAFLLKDLFLKDSIYNVYSEELSSILNSIEPNEIPDNYSELVKENLANNTIKKVKFDNDILHRSKVIKHFLDNNEEISKTTKDFKFVYKKIKRNKKYFISIKDIVVLESLEADGIILPEGLDYKELSSQLTAPINLEDLVKQNQIGLVMLKIVELIGEDNISDLDPETIYFINSILNKLKLKKIRNNILSKVLPNRV